MAKLDDNLTASGAQRLAERIRKYWKAQGHTVIVTVVPMHGTKENCAHFAVRSDMINGMPRVKGPANENIEQKPYNSAAA